MSQSTDPTKPDYVAPTLQQNSQQTDASGGNAGSYTTTSQTSAGTPTTRPTTDDVKSNISGVENEQAPKAISDLVTEGVQAQDNTDLKSDPNASVSGRVNQIISEGSPLMERAETRAKEQMNGRGLLNSSMAVGAGQTALYDAAMPMAAQDASYAQNMNLAEQKRRDSLQQLGYEDIYKTWAANLDKGIKADAMQHENILADKQYAATLGQNYMNLMNKLQESNMPEGDKQKAMDLMKTIYGDLLTDLPDFGGRTIGSVGVQEGQGGTTTGTSSGTTTGTTSGVSGGSTTTASGKNSYIPGVVVDNLPTDNPLRINGQINGVDVSSSGWVGGKAPKNLAQSGSFRQWAVTSDGRQYINYPDKVTGIPKDSENLLYMDESGKAPIDRSGYNADGNKFAVIKGKTFIMPITGNYKNTWVEAPADYKLQPKLLNDPLLAKDIKPLAPMANPGKAYDAAGKAFNARIVGPDGGTKDPATGKAYPAPGKGLITTSSDGKTRQYLTNDGRTYNQEYVQAKDAKGNPAVDKTGAPVMEYVWKQQP